MTCRYENWVHLGRYLTLINQTNDPITSGRYTRWKIFIYSEPYLTEAAVGMAEERTIRLGPV